MIEALDDLEGNAARREEMLQKITGGRTGDGR